MSVIQIQSPGLFTTVQDLGRPGFGPMGLSPSGAADPIALRLGNRLVGNADSVAALEMTLIGGTFLFPEGGMAALAGSDFGASLDDQPVTTWVVLKIKSGQTLRLGPTRSGARCYLCIQGGIKVNSFLGSASTHILSGLGGFEGRALRKGDVLNVGQAAATFRQRKISSQLLESLSPRRVLRVTSGPQSEWFPESSQELFYSKTYRVTEDSNRMGLRLEGTAIPPHSKGQMITEGVCLGAVQIPDGGQPIILFVEQQTTGGYPKIANVISADLPSIGQLRPHDEIRFKKVDFKSARDIFKEQEAILASKELIEE
jgi:antagonist of KipI